MMDSISRVHVSLSSRRPLHNAVALAVIPGILFTPLLVSIAVATRMVWVLVAGLAIILGTAGLFGFSAALIAAAIGKPWGSFAGGLVVGGLFGLLPACLDGPTLVSCATCCGATAIFGGLINFVVDLAVAAGSEPYDPSKTLVRRGRRN